MNAAAARGGLDVAAAGLDAQAAYALLTSLVVPRPIAWVSTLSGGGQRNLAPHSYFNLISSEPPIIHVTSSQRRGRPKKTAPQIKGARGVGGDGGGRARVEVMNDTRAER